MDGRILSSLRLDRKAISSPALDPILSIFAFQGEKLRSN
jgi:hypothetical protein